MAHQREDLPAQRAISGGVGKIQRLDEVASRKSVQADVVRHCSGLVGELGRDREQLASYRVAVTRV